MKTTLFRCAVAGLLLICFAGLAAAAEVPEAGLKAEMAGEWEEALRIYQAELDKAPDRADLWVRMADIQAHLKRPRDAILSLIRANDQQPHNARLLKRLSEAQASDKQPEAALRTCQEALDQAPDDLGIRRDCARLATWTGDYQLAKVQYATILEHDPENAAALLGTARVNIWSGCYRQGLAAYRDYLDKYPDDRPAWLEFAQAQIWTGDYAAAQKTLDRYQARFGQDDIFRARQARLLVRAGRPEAAERINAPLLAADPDNYYLHLTHTLILRDHRQPTAARDSLAELRRLQPDSRDTRDMTRFVLTPQRSNIEGRFYYSHDSDHIQVLRSELIGTAFLHPQFSLLAGGSWEQLRAKTGSGFETTAGKGTIADTTGWGGFRYRIQPLIGIDGRVGAGSVQNGRDFWLFQGGVDLDPHDRFSARLQYDRKLYSVSPRSVSLGILSNGATLDLNWRPTFRTTVIGQGGYADLSDGNRRWEAIFSPRYAVMRTTKFNLDLGLLGWWIGYAKDLNNGYYDPSLYQRYAGLALGTWKISDDDLVAFNLSLGEQRDTFDNKFTFGTDVYVEGTFGLYRDWMLKVGSGYTDRSRSSGAYDAWSGTISLMRRF